MSSKLEEIDLKYKKRISKLKRGFWLSKGIKAPLRLRRFTPINTQHKVMIIGFILWSIWMICGN